MHFGLLIFIGITVIAVNFKTSIDDYCIEYITQIACSSTWQDPETGQRYNFVEGVCLLPFECASEERIEDSAECGDVRIKYYYESCDRCTGGQCIQKQTPAINDYPFGQFDPSDGTYRMFSADENWWGPLHGITQTNPTVYSARPNYIYLTVIISSSKMRGYADDPLNAISKLEEDIATRMDILSSQVRVTLFMMCHMDWVSKCFAISGTVPPVWQEYVQAETMPSTSMIGLTTVIEVNSNGDELRSEFTQLVEDLQTDQVEFYENSDTRTHVQALLLNYQELDETYYTPSTNDDSSTSQWIIWAIVALCVCLVCCVIAFVYRNRTCTEEDKDWERMSTMRSFATSMHSRFNRSFYTSKTRSIADSDSNSENEAGERNQNIVSAFGIQGKSKRLTRQDYQEHVSRKELHELAYDTPGGDFEHTLVTSRV